MHHQAERPTGTEQWPAIFDVRAGFLLTVVAGFVALAFTATMALDVLRLNGDPIPVAAVLYNDGPVEWVQWFLLPTAVALSAFLAARVDGGAAVFFFWWALGLALMFMEDASDLRHTLYRDYVEPGVGLRLLGVPSRVVSDGIYLSAIASVPVYATVRYGRHLWPLTGAHRCFFAGVGLYGVAAGGSALRHLGDLYETVGGWIDRTLLGGRWPTSLGVAEERAHFMLVDGMIEESLETLGACCLVAALLAAGQQIRREGWGSGR